MCGICGVVLPGGRVDSADVECVAHMVAMLRHRGPDGEGVWTRPQLAIGHARLAIIDVAGGHQPMLNEAGDVAVTFNGEIYNFAELRQQLRAAGHRFATRSDTEVIVHGYEEWGDDVTRRLQGMFAFAVWDERRSRVLFARDRFGEKPLYHARLASGAVVFASEIKAVVAHRDVPRALNRARLAEYLAFRSVAGEETLFDGVRQLPPGCMMSVEPGRTRQWQYWSADPGSAVRVTSRALPMLANQGATLLERAVQARLVSDVPLGTITSGGLDSSLVSAIAQRHAGRTLDTFCVGFADPAYDERPFARTMSSSIGSRLHELEVDAGDIAAAIDDLTFAHDEPLTHPNSIPMHLLFRHAKDDVGITVLLSGEGADEVFGGYDWYRVAAWRELLGAAAPLHPLIPPVGALATVRRVLHPEYLLAASAVTSPAAVRALGHGDALSEARRRQWPAGRRGRDGLFVYDQRTYLPPLLQRQDRMSMAAGVEARVVFLDDALVHWANALPAGVKLAGGAAKALLKRIAERWIPPEIVTRGKVGFTLPLDDWLRARGPLRERVDALRDGDSIVRDVVDGARLERVLTEHETSRASHGALLWTLVALDAWARVFLGPVVREPVRHAVMSGRP